MKSKLSLRNRLTVLRKGKGRSKVVAVAGVASGVGVTHSVMAMANCLRRGRLKVAVVELSGNRHFEAIERSYEGKGFDASSTEDFVIKSVTYYKQVKRHRLLEICQENYDVVLMDIGTNVSPYIEDFRMADYQIVVGRLIDWKVQEIYAFAIRNSGWLNDRSKWLLPFASKGEVKEMINEGYGVCVSFDFLKDPFVRSVETDNQVIQLFS